MLPGCFPRDSRRVHSWKRGNSRARRWQICVYRTAKAITYFGIASAGIRRAVAPRKATWIIQYRIGVKQRRHTLGDAKTINGDKARNAAKDRLAQVRLGGDPQADKVEARAKSGITLGSKVEIYLADKNVAP